MHTLQTFAFGIVLLVPFFIAHLFWRRGNRLAALLVVSFGACIWAGALTSTDRIPRSAIPRANSASRAQRQQAECIANLKQLAEAKRSWTALTKPETSTSPQASDLAAYLKQGQLPVCPTGGTYTLGAVNEPPRCSHADKGHALTPPR